MVVDDPTRAPVTARAAKGLRRWAEAWLARSSLVPTTAFLDPSDFDWVVALERHWAEIRAELDGVLVDPRAGCPAVSDDGWESIFLAFYGSRAAPRAATQCPRTIELLADIAGLRAASFSLLYPGATIAPHRGPYRGVLRYHLALMVPEPADACGLRIDGETRQWREGRSLVFDESFRHEAWNHSDGLRVVLFLDIVRPLRQPARAFNGLALHAFAWLPAIRRTRRRHEVWERSAAPRPPERQRASKQVHPDR